MEDMDMIDSCQAHLFVQLASNSEYIRQKWHWWGNWQQVTPDLQVQNKLLVCSNGCRVHTACSIFPFNTPTNPLIR